jgi:hypothetical protein
LLYPLSYRGSWGRSLPVGRRRWRLQWLGEPIPAGRSRHTRGQRPADDPRATGELNELISELLGEIEYLRTELEYARLLGERPPGVVDAVRADPSLRQDDRDRLITLYRDLLRRRARD